MRYLTKSKFLLGMECPTKLFYTGKPEYADRRIEDTFLRELANGGFQVGALARCYFPDGIAIETPNDETAVEITAEYLAREDNITLFEAAFRFGKLLVRADVVVKTGGGLDIYEVKAKSCDFADEGGMTTKGGMPLANWEKYINDIAFQKHVIEHAYPDLNVRAHLMLADKTTVCSTDGLNQKFQLVREEGRRRIRVSDTLCDADLTPRLLRPINVDATCEKVFASLVGDRRFDDHITFLADSYARDQKIISPPSKACGKCEFRLADLEASPAVKNPVAIAPSSDTKNPVAIAPGSDRTGQVSGFRECWTASLNWTAEDFAEPTVLDIWNLRTKDELLAGGKIKFSQLSQDDIKPKPDGKPGVSRAERQWKQVEKVQQGDKQPWIDLSNLREELNGWTYPLHFIDFETSKPAIPFKKGRRPYGGVLFQFSHHSVDENGHIDHAGQFLSTEPGVFPNYDCVRELKRQIDNDLGTVFRYHNHENTFLCEVYDQLLNDPEDIPDRAELCEFIRSITNSSNPENPWTGSRGMVDLYRLVERYHYDPGTNGSVSLKYVLPAALNSSAFLKEKYAQPIYGTPEMPSRNFTAQTWVQYADTGQVSDPYELLPMLFTDETGNDYRLVIEMDKINDGGAAMTAYCKLQFENIPHDIRHGIESALLKYCELDTLAMVMLYESWKALI